MKFTFFSVLSLAFHAALLLALFLWKPDFSLKTDLKRPVEVIYTKKPNETERFEKPFVRQVKIPENLKFEDPAEAQFTSEMRQRVLQETKARLSGLTRNRDRGPRYMEESFETPTKEKKKKISKDGDEFTVFNPKNEIQKIQGGESTISVRLPDNIAIGSFTALNTDRHIYYSFYTRLEDMIYLRWADLIKKAVDQYSIDFKKKKLTGRSWKTEVVILLRPNGEFYQAQINTPSGIDRFDISPALAFQDARVFPNPPQEMVRSDGFIHISYSFVVDFGQVQ